MYIYIYLYDYNPYVSCPVIFSEALTHLNFVTRNIIYFIFRFLRNLKRMRSLDRLFAFGDSSPALLSYPSYNYNRFLNTHTHKHTYIPHVEINI